MSEENFSLAMPFLDESCSFCYGFEMGQLWEKLKSGEIIDKERIHAENASQAVLMCEYYKSEYEFDNLSHGWLTITIK